MSGLRFKSGGSVELTIVEDEGNAISKGNNSAVHSLVCRLSPLSYRNLEEMMQERGVYVDH